MTEERQRHSRQRDRGVRDTVEKGTQWSDQYREARETEE